MNWRKVLVGVFIWLLVVLILSSTLGRDMMSGKQPTLSSFSVIHFSGYLFFIILPVEALIPYYLAQGHAGFSLLVIALITAILAQLIDYSLGFLLSNEIIGKVISEWRYRKSQKMIERYGDWALFFFNLLPLSSPILIFTAGVARFPLTRVLLFSSTGLFVKYVVLILTFKMFF